MPTPFARLSAALADRYRIERDVGAGGMATVYLAEDLKHDRKVALKVLKPELAAVLGAERFVVEIKTTAALQHPHILPLFDSGTADGFLYYVMPFIDGETLRGKLDRETQLGVDEAVKLASAVADALDYAHRHGVIHRDIKPENILLHDGRPMVADFGIALAVSAAAGGRMTETGLSLGTPHYMSPEQATAEKDISARSDVYSLGTVLYEMLAGQPPHMGGSAQQIIMKIITEPAAPVVQLRKSVPPNVAAAVARALEKLPADRFESARAFAEALSNPHFAGEHATVASAAFRSGAPWQRRAAMLGVSTVVAMAAALWGWSRSVPSALPQPPSRLVLESADLGGTAAVAQIALTPDGSALVYGAVVDGKGVTRLRPLYAAGAITIPGAPYLGSYQISADGRELAGFLETGALVRYPLRGGSGGALPASFGPGKTQGAISGAYGGDSGDGAYWITTADSVLRLSVADGRVSRAVATQRDSLLIAQVLPGNRLAVAIYPTVINRMSAASGPAYLLDLKTGAATMLFDARVIEIRYTSGYLVYVLDNGSMEARPFDPARGAPPGDPTPIASDVSLDRRTAHVTVSANGTVAYVPDAPRSLVLIDRFGARAPLLQGRPQLYGRAQFSPDGARISLSFESADGQDVWILTLSDSTLSRATIDRFGTSANWSSDGRSLIYASLRTFSSGAVVFRVPLGRPEAAESLFTSQQLRGCCLSLPDGSALIVAAYGLSPQSGYDIGIVRTGGQRTVEPVLATRFDETTPALTRDGKWLAYTSNQSGRDEVYVQSLDGTSGQVQVSTVGGTQPIWGPDGRELFYRGVPGRGGTEQLMAATVETRPTPRVTSRRTLFPLADIMAGDGETNYDVSPDGPRFVMVPRNRPTQVVVIQNLPALVRQLEGAGRKVP